MEKGMTKVLSESEQLNQFIAETVWMAWAAGHRCGSSDTPVRTRDRDREGEAVHKELEKVKKAVTRLLDKR
jgi:hypothetical protein